MTRNFGSPIIGPYQRIESGPKTQLIILGNNILNGRRPIEIRRSIELTTDKG